MRKIGHALFWWLVGLLVLMVFIIVYALLAVVDDCLGWVERKINTQFDALTRDIW